MKRHRRFPRGASALLSVLFLLAALPTIADASPPHGHHNTGSGNHSSHTGDLNSTTSPEEAAANAMDAQSQAAEQAYADAMEREEEARAELENNPALVDAILEALYLAPQETPAEPEPAPSEALYESEGETPADTAPAAAPTPEPWADGFTDPAAHNGDDFRYVVHAVAEEALVDMAPADIPTRQILSTSVIDQEHTGTYELSGFILDVPPENLIAASSGDMHIQNNHDSEEAADAYAAELAETHGTPPPEDLLNNTDTDFGYNEVAVRGTREDSAATVVGVFVVVGPDGTPLVADYAALEAYAAANNLPLIEIPYHVPGDNESQATYDPTPYLENP